MAAEVKAAGYLFPYLYDESQAVAKAYHAACTPDIFLFDRGRRLVYRGQFDASRPGNGIPVTGKDVRAALDAVLAGKPLHNFKRPAQVATSSGRPETRRDIPKFFVAAGACRFVASAAASSTGGRLNG